jgi:hypothetical protein
LTIACAALDVVGADMRQDALDPVDAAVDGDDGNARLHRLLDRGSERVDVKRRDHDRVDLLHDRGLDVGGLLGRRVLAVALDQIDALRLGLDLDLVEHVDEEREAEARHRAENGQLVLGECARCGDRQRAERGGRHQKLTSVHGHFTPPGGSNRNDDSAVIGAARDRSQG